MYQMKERDYIMPIPAFHGQFLYIILKSRESEKETKPIKFLWFIRMKI